MPCVLSRPRVLEVFPMIDVQQWNEQSLGWGHHSLVKGCSTSPLQKIVTRASRMRSPILVDVCACGGYSTGTLRPGCLFSFPAFGLACLWLADPKWHLSSQNAEHWHNVHHMMSSPLATKPSGSRQARFTALKMILCFRHFVF